MDEAGRARMERSRRNYPRSFSAVGDKARDPFPILADPDRVVSGGLGFFTADWGGSPAEPNVPTVLVIGSDGVLPFKYMNQNTLDRPPLQYLVRLVETLNRGQG
jgi:hypothetical protein